jgi:hypothetical protein
MKQNLLASVLIVLIFTSSCQINRRSMRESNYQLWLNKSDMIYTEHKMGQATQTKIFGIDWQRLFSGVYEYGGIGNLPLDPGPVTNASINVNQASMGGSLGNQVNSIISNSIGVSSSSKAEQFAINDLITKNPGYDVILFPQFEVKKKWFLIGSKTQVEVKARLAKLTPNSQ